MVKKILGILVALILLIPPVSAQTVLQNAGTTVGKIKKLNCSTGTTCTESAGTGTIVVNGSQTITGGTINGATIGATSPSTSVFSTLRTTGTVSIGTTSTTAAVQVGSGTPTAGGISSTNDVYIAGDLEVDGLIYADNNIGIGTTRPAANVQLGAGSVAGVMPASSLAVKGSVEIDTNLYVDSSIYASAITGGYALCVTGTAGGMAAGGGYLGHCTTTPTNGACTCVKN